MKRFVRISSVFAVLVVISMAFSSCGYNTILTKDEAAQAAWADVQAAYQRRMDLIPNLVNTVKAYAEHEQSVLVEVAEARSRASSMQLTPELMNNPQAFEQFQQSQQSLSGALSRLMVVVEQYPDLKANQNFSDLQHQLEGTENRINVARLRFNEAVRDFNLSIRRFPNSITNSLLLHLERKMFFAASEGAENAPEVNFD